MEVQFLHGFLRRFGHASAINYRQKSEEPLHRFTAKENVIADGQIIGQCQILVDRLNATVAGFLGRGKRDAFAIKKYVAMIILEHPGDRLDQR